VVHYGGDEMYTESSLQSRLNFKDLGVDGGAMFHNILNKHVVRIRTGSVSGPVTGLCEYCDGHWGYVKHVNTLVS
jgi:hypothetical protein